MTRRETLALTGAAAASSLLPELTRAADKPADEPRWIDAHSHIWTREVDRFPLANGQTVDDLKPPSFTAEEALALMRPEGVRRVVLIQHHIYHGWDNSYLIDAAARYPDVFRVVGMIDDTKPQPDVAMRELLKKRVTAFRITSLIRGADKWLDGPGMRAIWNAAAETRQAMCCLINPQDLPSVNRMCKQFPDTPVVIDHFARIGADGTVKDEDLKNLCALARHPLTRVKISAYYALGKKQAPYLDLVPMIRELLDAFGPNRLMWASDCPYQNVQGHTFGDSIALVRDRLDFVTKEDREWLLWRTADRVFFYK